jgi:flagellin
MVINTNLSAESSARLLQSSSTKLSKSLSRLSSGSKITSPGDDVAGQAVSMRFDAQISRINAAVTNISNANSYAQTQDGYLGKVSDALNRMSELAILAQDSTKSDSDRALYNQEFQTLGTYITDLSTKDFNGVSLFAGTGLTVTTDSEGSIYTMSGIDLSSQTYTDAHSANITTATDASAALTAVKLAITQLATDRASVGANVASLTMYGDQLGVLKDNLSSANSNIKDVDVAGESTQYARYNILVQSGVAMLAQANSMPQYMLKLLNQ